MGYKELPVQTEVADTSTATLVIDVGGPSLVSISVDTLRKLVGTDIIETLQFVKWVDALPETGESKYIYAVPREETDTEGKQIAALYLWDGSAWRGAAAFSLNIDPDTLATKTELAEYVKLSTKGVANGVASLDANGKVPAEQIPVATASALGGVKLEFDETTGTLNIKTE